MLKRGVPQNGGTPKRQQENYDHHMCWTINGIFLTADVRDTGCDSIWLTWKKLLYHTVRLWSENCIYIYICKNKTSFWHLHLARELTWHFYFIIFFGSTQHLGGWPITTLRLTGDSQDKLPDSQVPKSRIRDPNIYPLKMDGSEGSKFPLFQWSLLKVSGYQAFKGIWLSGYGTWFGDMLIMLIWLVVSPTNQPTQNLKSMLYARQIGLIHPSSPTWGVKKYIFFETATTR